MTSEIDWQEREREIDRKLASLRRREEEESKSPCEDYVEQLSVETIIMTKMKAQEVVHTHMVLDHGATPFKLEKPKPFYPFPERMKHQEESFEDSIQALTNCILREAKKQK